MLIIFTRRFEDQPEIDEVDERVRVVRIPCGGNDFIPKEYLYEHIPEFADNLQNWIITNKHQYKFINSHYWDAGLAGEILRKELSIPHIHTPHSVGIWKKNNMEKDFDKSEAEFEKIYNFEDRTKYEETIFNDCSGLVATTPIQQEMLINEYELPEQKVTMIPPGYDDNKFFPYGRCIESNN